MKQLIMFSLRRRFINRLSFILNSLTLAIVLLLFNADHVAHGLNLSIGQLTPIMVDEITRSLLLDESEWVEAGFTFATDAKIEIRTSEGQYVVSGAADPLTQNALMQLLLKSHQWRILAQSDPSVEEFLVTFNAVNVTFDPPWDPLAAMRENLLFSVLSAAYFMVLNFIAVNSGEIIAEKTSNVLEMILSRLKPHDHFLAKVITGLGSLMIQWVILGVIVGLTAVARWRHDRFVDLIRFAIRVLKVDPDVVTTETLQIFLSPSPELMGRFAAAMGILLMGMAILLVVIIIVSAHVKTVEEAAMIQGPFYVGLLTLYYLSLGLMSPQSLETGWGKLVSLMPIGSMLLMGMRILNGTVRSVEVLFAVSLSMLFFGVVIGVGYPIYRRGLIR